MIDRNDFSRLLGPKPRHGVPAGAAFSNASRLPIRHAAGLGAAAFALLAMGQVCLADDAPPVTPTAQAPAAAAPPAAAPVAPPVIAPSVPAAAAPEAATPPPAAVPSAADAAPPAAVQPSPPAAAATTPPPAVQPAPQPPAVEPPPAASPAPPAAAETTPPPVVQPAPQPPAAEPPPPAAPPAPPAAAETPPPPTADKPVPAATVPAATTHAATVPPAAATSTAPLAAPKAAPDTPQAAPAAPQAAPAAPQAAPAAAKAPPPATPAPPAAATTPPSGAPSAGVAPAAPAGKAASHKATPAAPRSCADVSAALAAARKAGDLKALVSLYAEATRPATACAPKVTFCLGRSVALAHVEAAYALADKGKTTAAAALFAKGHRFGEPWPLLIGLGDGLSEKAGAAHSGKLWSDASYTYQMAIAALGEPVLCEDEPVPPSAEDLDRISLRMATAMLLANPVKVYHSKCAPCDLAFLAHLSGSTLKTQALPITFKLGKADLTPEGLQAAKALLDCVKRQKWTKITVSDHTDEQDSAAGNATLSGQRLDTLKKMFAAAGYTGAFEAEPKGMSQPFKIETPSGFKPYEVHRLNRRVELHGLSEAPPLQCTPAVKAATP